MPDHYHSQATEELESLLITLYELDLPESDDDDEQELMVDATEAVDSMKREAEALLTELKGEEAEEG